MLHEEGGNLVSINQRNEKMNLFERTLPTYLQNDIAALEEGIRKNSTLIDCLWSEVYGSINSAFYDNEISKEQADYLRKKYLGLGE